jgi:hypothetical protein
MNMSFPAHRSRSALSNSRHIQLLNFMRLTVDWVWSENGFDAGSVFDFYGSLDPGSQALKKHSAIKHVSRCVVHNTKNTDLLIYTLLYKVIRSLVTPWSQYNYF